MTNFWLFVIAGELNPSLIETLMILGAVGATALWLFELVINPPAWMNQPPPPSEEQLAEQNARRDYNREALEGKFDNSWFRRRAP